MRSIKLSLHIFRNDLRLHDNSALISALSQSDLVIPIFIFDPSQQNSPYRSDNSVRFMVKSLIELDGELRSLGSKLYFFQGQPTEVIDSLLCKLDLSAVYVNRGYTPFSIKRDEEIALICKKHKAFFYSFADSLLTEPEQVLKPDKTPYSVFTPFMKKARQIAVPIPQKNNYSNYFKQAIENSFEINDPELFLPSPKRGILLKGGRSEALSLLNKTDYIPDYYANRNYPNINGTTTLSAHHKFGTISIRETYHNVAKIAGTDHTLISELYWRDFFKHVGFHFPKVFGNPFYDKYNNLNWSNNNDFFNRWSNGTTGFPIVDAGIRELLETGFMHNRVRMVVASFLTKDLHIDWRWGEKFFAKHLLDYDPAVNNGNWQWAASTGCDAQPYFRIFNPWNQQKKFDPNALYIKKWIPELYSLSTSEIHTPNYESKKQTGYPAPIINHADESEKAKLMFKCVGQREEKNPTFVFY